MKRGQLLVKMATERTKVSLSSQEKENQQEKGFYARKRKKKPYESNSNTFNYLQMYDEGNWGALDSVLQKPIHGFKSLENLQKRKRKRLDFSSCDENQFCLEMKDSTPKSLPLNEQKPVSLLEQSEQDTLTSKCLTSSTPAWITEHNLTSMIHHTTPHYITLNEPWAIPHLGQSDQDNFTSKYVPSTPILEKTKPDLSSNVLTFPKGLSTSTPKQCKCELANNSPLNQFSSNEYDVNRTDNLSDEDITPLKKLEENTSASVHSPLILFDESESDNLVVTTPLREDPTYDDRINSDPPIVCNESITSSTTTQTTPGIPLFSQSNQDNLTSKYVTSPTPVLEKTKLDISSNVPTFPMGLSTSTPKQFKCNKLANNSPLNHFKSNEYEIITTDYLSIVLNASSSSDENNIPLKQLEENPSASVHSPLILFDESESDNLVVTTPIREDPTYDDQINSDPPIVCNESITSSTITQTTPGIPLFSQSNQDNLTSKYVTSPTPVLEKTKLDISSNVPTFPMGLSTSTPKQFKCNQLANNSPLNQFKSNEYEIITTDYLSIVLNASSSSDENNIPLKQQEENSSASVYSPLIFLYESESDNLVTTPLQKDPTYDDSINSDPPYVSNVSTTTQTTPGIPLFGQSDQDNSTLKHVPSPNPVLEKTYLDLTSNVSTFPMGLSTSTPKQLKCNKFSNNSPLNQFNSNEYAINPTDNLSIMLNASISSDENIAPLKEQENNPSVSVHSPLVFFNESVSDNLVVTTPLQKDPTYDPPIECNISTTPQEARGPVVGGNVVAESKDNKKKRRYDRRNYCFFCGQLVLQIRRHFLNNHKNEMEIAQYIALFELNSEDTKVRRKQMLADLTAKGNHIYNKSILNNSSSETDTSLLLPVKRPAINKKKNSNEYVFCTLCHGLFVKSCFRLHASACKEKDTSEINSTLVDPDTQEEEYQNLSECDQKILNTRRNNYVKEFGIPTYLNPKETSKRLQEHIIPVLRKDEIGIIGMQDPLIMSLASDFYSSHKADKDKTQVTRKIRDAAKLLIKVREKNPEIKVLADLFTTRYLEIVLEACQSLCNLDNSQGDKVIVGMNARLSWILEEGSKRLKDDIACRSDIADEEKEVKINKVKHFQECLRRRWKYYISTNTEVSRRRLKICKEFLLPLDEDIKTFAKMLRDMEVEFKSKLKTKVTIFHYEMLCKIVICHILTLNRRRPFEATNAEIEFYLNRKKGGDYYSVELLNTFASEEQVAFNELSSFVVPAKGTESVATILMTKQMEDCIDLIINCRPILKLEQNQYLFARPGLTTPFDGSKVLREMKVKCTGLIKPDHLTATGLRHQVATLAHVKGPTFSSKVSNFMTHTMAVHEKNYVAPLSMVHRGVIGNYMAELEGTNLLDNGPREIDDNSTMEYPQTSTHNNNHDPTYVPTYEEEIDFDESEEKRKRNITKRCNRQKWTDTQKETLLNYFKDFIKNKKNPGTLRCREFLSKFGDLFQGKTPNTLNVYIDNINRNKSKVPIQLTHFLK